MKKVKEQKPLLKKVQKQRRELLSLWSEVQYKIVYDDDLSHILRKNNDDILKQFSVLPIPTYNKQEQRKEGINEISIVLLMSYLLHMYYYLQLE